MKFQSNNNYKKIRMKLKQRRKYCSLGFIFFQKEAIIGSFWQSQYLLALCLLWTAWPCKQSSSIRVTKYVPTFILNIISPKDEDDSYNMHLCKSLEWSHITESLTSLTFVSIYEEGEHKLGLSRFSYIGFVWDSAAPYSYGARKVPH